MIEKKIRLIDNFDQIIIRDTENIFFENLFEKKKVKKQ